MSTLENPGTWRLCNDADHDEILIVSASYEPRSTAVCERLGNDYKATSAMVYVNEEFLAGNGSSPTNSHLQQLNALLANHTSSLIVSKGSLYNPLKQLESIKNGLSQIIEKSDLNKMNFTIDSTTFNREALLVLTLLLVRMLRVAHCRILYVAPEKHGEWLSQGFRCIRNVVGFSGIQRHALPTALVVLSGFEGDRVLRVIDEHEPTKVLLGLGNPATDSGFFVRNKEEQRLILGRQDVEQFAFPVNSIHECRKRLEEVVGPYLEKYNIILAPMSTKLSTLGAMLFAIQHPEVQITYCVPGEYNLENYSSGVKGISVERLEQV